MGNVPWCNDLHPITLPGPQTHFIKLRPGLREFLNEANQLFEVYIYTQVWTHS
jgi:TFIIF-interacting CTD phosphatase-like protein